MKKKLLSMVLSTAMVAGILAGCGSNASSETASADKSDAAATETEAPAEAATEEAVPTNTFGDPSGTHLEMWTFVELHGQHYGNMVEKWNEENPDRKIEITCTTYPYGDMHTKLLTSLEAGTGAPDICDVGVDNWLPVS